MKIAYIFFGQVKNFDDRQFYSIQQNILEKLSDHSIDFFLTTSIRDSYFNIRNKETEDIKQNINPKSINKFFDFKKIVYDNINSYPEKEISDLANNLLSFGESWNEGSALHSTINSLKQLYGLNYFYNHFLQYIENYDYFIISRSDLYHISPIDLNFLSENKDIWIPFWNNIPQIDYGNFGGLNDRFAVIKTKKTLELYCTRYNKILKSPQAYHAETYLKQILDSQNIKYGKINNFLFEMMRAGGVISDLVGTSKDENMNKNLNNISNCFYINLDRREDRRNHFITNTPFFAQRFSAVDAKSAELNEEIKKLFPKTWNSRKKSEICCALSHYKLWKKLIEDNSSKNYLILEDDVVFKKGFAEFWNEVFSEFVPNSYNLIYLGGCQPWNKPKYHEAVKRYNDYFYNVKKNDFFSKGDHFWHMTTCSYIISKQAASLMCQYIDQFGMDQPLDFFMLRFFDNNKFFSAPDSVFHLNPLMARQLHEENDNTAIDEKSDIRNDESVFEELDNNRLIPKIIHQTWKDDHLKKDLENLWTSKNPNYEYNFYNDNDIEKIIKENFDQRIYKCYKRLIAGAAKADFFRYCIIYLEGGIYCDIDFIPHVGFDDFISKELEIVVCDDQYGLFNAFIASKPKHDFFLSLIDKICNQIDSGLFRNGGFDIVSLCGCGILRDHFVEHFTKNKSPQNKRLILHHNTSTENKDFIELNGKKLIDCQANFQCQKEQFNNNEHYTKIDYLYTEADFNITKIIHQSWKTKDIPYSVYKKEWIDSWKQKNPDWEYKFWTDEDNRNLVEKYYPQYLELYDSYERPIAKADISRFFYLHKYGGLYVDLDFMCLKSLDQVIDGEKINLGRQKMKNELLAQNSVPNALMYSPPGDIFWIQCIEELKHHKHNQDGSLKGTEHATGPIFLGKCIDKFKPKNLLIHNETTFYPISWELSGSSYNGTIKKEWLDNPKSEFPNSFAVTYWSGNWRKNLKENKRKMIILSDNLFEEDFIDELFEGIEYEKAFDPKMETIQDGSIIVYSDIYAKNVDIYPEKYRQFFRDRFNQLQEYFAKCKNCILVHLSDEHCHAEIDHYKNFKHVFRQYYRSDAVADNVTFIPLGYKKGFNHE